MMNYSNRDPRKNSHTRKHALEHKESATEGVQKNEKARHMKKKKY